MNRIKYLLIRYGFIEWQQCMKPNHPRASDEDSFDYCVLAKGHPGDHRTYNGENFAGNWERTAQEKV